MSLSSNEIYKNLAPFYRSYSNKKQAYLNGVDVQILPYISDRISLLDLGTGDGVRILNLVQKSHKKLKKITLVDSCFEMLSSICQNNIVSVERTDFSQKGFKLKNKYDLITCLWNVMGHIDSSSVEQAFLGMKRHLKENGVIILDVNNRYNYKQYGWKAIRNFVLDKFRKKKTGDIFFNFTCANKKIPSFVHLFSQKEIEDILKKAHLKVHKRLYINYKTGTLENGQFSGQLFYVLVHEK